MMDHMTAAISEILPEITALRHELHAHPEAGFEEEWTSDRIARFLGEAGIACKRGYARGTGIVADIEGEGRKTIALRADMDGLEMQEESRLPYVSKVPNRMHACGHDGHAACLCGAAKIFARHRERLRGRVRLIFQPAEEPVSGASCMVSEGVMNGVDAVFALHAWPALPAGHIGVRAGTIMAGASRFRITVHGKGCHGAEPAAGIDPVVAAAHITTVLQTVVSRELDPLETGVVTVGRIVAGTAPNIIPETATLEGTCRALTTEDGATLARSVQRIAEHTARALRATAEVEFQEVPCPPTVNDPRMVDLVRATIGATLGHDKSVEIARPSMAAEDFAFYLQKAPGALLWLGNAPGDGRPPASLHSACFDFNDETIPAALALLTGIATRFFQ